MNTTYGAGISSRDEELELRVDRPSYIPLYERTTAQIRSFIQQRAGGQIGCTIFAALEVQKETSA